MFRIKGCIGALVLSAAMVTPLLTSGCAARLRYYDYDHHDYHHWDNREDHEYRIWLGERHYQYREFNSLSGDQQRDYWNWRHNHHDNH